MSGQARTKRERKAGSMVRSWAMGVIAGLVGLALTSCGGSSQSSSVTESTVPPPGVSPSPEEANPPADEPLAYVGAITGTDGEGTTFGDRYRIGPLLDSSEETPPEAVLNACNANYSAVL